MSVAEHALDAAACQLVDARLTSAVSPGLATGQRAGGRREASQTHLAAVAEYPALVEKRGSASEGSDLNPAPKTWLNRYRREHSHLNQGPLAAAAGISERTLQRLESGKHPNPPVRYLISCAVALELDDWHLLLEDQWREPLPRARSVFAPRGHRTG